MSGHRQKGESAPNIVNSAIITLLYAFGNSHFLTAYNVIIMGNPGTILGAGISLLDYVI